MKILFGFLFVVLLIIGHSLYTIWNIQQSNKAITSLQQEQVPVLIHVESLSLNVANRLALSRGYLLLGAADYREQFQTLTAESKEIEEWLLAHTTEDEMLQIAINSVQNWAVTIEEKVFPAYERAGQAEAMQVMFTEG